MATGPVNRNSLASALDPARAGGIDKASQGADKKSEKAGSAKTPGSTYDVNISPQAKTRAEERAKALDIARNTPDVREDKVSALKAQIAAGTYKPDPGRIADGMLREAIKEHLALDDR